VTWALSQFPILSVHVDAWPKSLGCLQLGCSFARSTERILELTAAWIGDGPQVLVCECCDRECAKGIEISAIEFETIRARKERFLVALDHHCPAQEQVLHRNSRFAVVRDSRVLRDTGNLEWAASAPLYLPDLT
jgi:hypothetical protein